MAISFYGNSIEFNHTISHKTPLQSITIFCSLNNLKTLPEQEQQFFHEHLGMLVNPDSNFVKGPHLFMTPDMKSAVSKIFSCTYSGATRLMFLKSQVTELLAHFIGNCDEASIQTVGDQEREKLYHAKAILADNIAAPPSLKELSRMIGLNSYKLKKNFKELFGVPVFKYLQGERLIKVHNMLRDSEVTVQEALEAYYFSKQHLTDDTYGKDYWICGVMIERLWEKFSLFINFENFLDTRQTRFDSIYTGSITNPVFRDIYAPVDGFVINGGIKLNF